MNWISLILGLLRFANWLFDYVKRNELIREGEDRAIAAETAKILLKTKRAKDVLEEISYLDSDAVDKLLRDLERPSGSG